MQGNIKTQVSRTIGEYQLDAKLMQQNNLYFRCTCFSTGKKPERYFTILSIDSMEPSMASYFGDLESVMAYLQCSEKIQVQTVHTIKIVVVQSLLSGKTVKRQWKIQFENIQVIPDEELQLYNKKYEEELLRQIKQLSGQAQNLKIQNKALKKQVQQLSQVKALNEGYLQKIKYLEEKLIEYENPQTEQLHSITVKQQNYTEISQILTDIDVYCDELTIHVTNTNPDKFKSQIENLALSLKSNSKLKTLKRIIIIQDHFLFEGQCYNNLLKFINSLKYLELVKIKVLNGCNIQPNNWTKRLKISALIQEEQ